MISDVGGEGTLNYRWERQEFFRPRSIDMDYKTAIEKGVLVNLTINNRAGGNVPVIAQAIAEKFLNGPKSLPVKQMNLW